MAKRCNPKTPISLEWFTVQHYSAYSVHIRVDVWAFCTKLHTIILNHIKLLCRPCRPHMAESDYFCSKCQRRETQRLITISPGYLLTYNLSHRPTDTLGVAWQAGVGTAWEEEHALLVQASWSPTSFWGQPHFLRAQKQHNNRCIYCVFHLSNFTHVGFALLTFLSGKGQLQAHSGPSAASHGAHRSCRPFGAWAAVCKHLANPCSHAGRYQAHKCPKTFKRTFPKWVQAVFVLLTCTRPGWARLLIAGRPARREAGQAKPAPCCGWRCYSCLGNLSMGSLRCILYVCLQIQHYHLVWAVSGENPDMG